MPPRCLHICVSCFSDSHENILFLALSFFVGPIMESKVDESARSAKRNEQATLTAFEAQRLIGICAELVDLCSGHIDPAVGEMIALAHDEVLTSVVEAKSSFDFPAHTRQ